MGLTAVGTGWDLWIPSLLKPHLHAGACTLQVVGSFNCSLDRDESVEDADGYSFSAARGAQLCQDRTDVEFYGVL